MIYLDNAASSWPKAPGVAEAVAACIEHVAANPGRGSHRMAVEASRILFDTRKATAKLMGIRNPNDIAFALNTTAALNLAIKGFVKPGDHVICTSVEHNSVRRPLEYLRTKHQVQLTYVQADARGRIEIDHVKRSIQSNTSLLIVNHSSNLLGSIIPLEELRELTRAAGIRMLVDAAQTAGILPLRNDKLELDMIAFPGHKGLLGPQGTGGLYIAPDVELEPLLHGGTGSQSEKVEQPSVRPDRYESGTPNTPGIAGLLKGVSYVLNETVETIHTKEWALVQRLMEGIARLDRVRVLGPDLGEDRTGIVAFTMDHVDSSEVAFILDQHYEIAVRSGYHCTPLAHETAGTSERGAVRASVGYFTTEEEVDRMIEAVAEISRHYS